jgi:selenoprotein W-related protein
MTTVEIEYCVPCGFRDRALDVQQAILSGLERELDAVTLEMGDRGIFQIRADGEVVYDKSQADLDVDEVVRKIRDRTRA